MPKFSRGIAADILVSFALSFQQFHLTTTAVFVYHGGTLEKRRRRMEAVSLIQWTEFVTWPLSSLNLSRTMRLALAFAAALAPLAVWGFALKPRSMDDQTPVMTMQGWDWTDCGASSL
jgi:hypothetical protein